VKKYGKEKNYANKGSWKEKKNYSQKNNQKKNSKKNKKKKQVK